MKILCCSVLFALVLPQLATADDRPHVVLVLADDLGYGDVHALNPESNLPTPNLDRLAAEGRTFTDAHSPSAVCTPTRYGLLTGRYAWRTRLTSGVLGGYSKPLLLPGRTTLADRLSAAGYRTAMVGKWHLGMELPLHEPGANVDQWPGDPGVDYTRTITDGPLQHGFQSFFGVTASLDMPPYVWVRDDRFSEVPTIEQPALPFPHFVRKGPRAEDLELDRALAGLIDEACAVIAESGSNDAPLFLYLPLTAPHKPAWPSPEARGGTELGEYGDLVAEVDAGIGRVRAALEEQGMLEETLFLVTSDNGSYMYRYAEDELDHVDDPTRHGFRVDRHRSNATWRGTKADIWEAGHRVPFLVRWPGKVEAGTRSAATICLTDVYATLVQILGEELRPEEAEDSFSLLPALTGEGEFVRAPVVHHSANGTFAIREGRWKLVLANGSGGREAPRGTPFEKPWQLYDLERDPGETRDLAGEHPDQVTRLATQLEEQRASGHSRP